MQKVPYLMRFELLSKDWEKRESWGWRVKSKSWRTCSSGVLYQVFMVLVARWWDNEAFIKVTEHYESWVMHCGVLQTAACSLWGSRILNPTGRWKPDPSAASLRWGNRSPGASVLILMYVRSGRSTSASQVYWFAHLKTSDPWRARYFPFIIPLQYEIQLLDILLAVKADCSLGCNSDSAASSLRDVGFPLCWHWRDQIWVLGLVWVSPKPGRE